MSDEEQVAKILAIIVPDSFEQWDEAKSKAKHQILELIKQARIDEVQLLEKINDEYNKQLQIHNYVPYRLNQLTEDK